MLWWTYGYMCLFELAFSDFFLNPQYHPDIWKLFPWAYIVYFIIGMVAKSFIGKQRRVILSLKEILISGRHNASIKCLMFGGSILGHIEN